jgi:hypothetical protein
MSDDISGQPAHVGPEAYGGQVGEEVMSIVGEAFQIPLLPGEGLPGSLRVYPTLGDAIQAASKGLAAEGSVLYVPSTGSAWVQLPGGEAPWPGDILDTPELSQYAGAARIALALAARGPVTSAAATGPSSAAELTAMAFPGPLRTVAARQGSREPGLAGRAGRRVAGLLRTARGNKR